MTRHRPVGRVLTPALMLVALLGFGSSFLTVSCGAPGGYGRSTQAGTTSYSGVALATGTAPRVDTAHLRPAAQRRDDTLPVQPLLLVAGICVAGIGVLAATRYRLRHLLVVGGVLIGADSLLAGVVLARAELIDRLGAQLHAPLPAGRQPADYVGIDQGTWLVLTLLALVGAGHLAVAAAQWRRRRGARRLRAQGTNAGNS